MTSTSDVLYRAADLIEERGWATGCGWPVTTKPTASLCLEGGIMAALGWWHDDADREDEVMDCPAYVAVKKHLGPRCRNAVLREDDAQLWAWNDTVAKSAAEVIEVLRATAVIEAARENAAEPVEVSS